MRSLLFAVLGPEIKLFLIAVAVTGPLAIIALILILKRIEKIDPERIRWR